MKKMWPMFIISFLMIVFFWIAGTAIAWQDPCSAIENTYEYEGYVLGNWTPATVMFSPAPECEGTVILLAPDGQWYLYDYIGNRGIITIAGVLPCRVADDGNLVCKIVTVPEESVSLVLNQQ